MITDELQIEKQSMRYQITGLQENRLWFAYAGNKYSADHIANLFRNGAHYQVTVVDLLVVAERQVA